MKGSSFGVFFPTLQSGAVTAQAMAECLSQQIGQPELGNFYILS